METRMGIPAKLYHWKRKGKVFLNDEDFQFVTQIVGDRIYEEIKKYKKTGSDHTLNKIYKLVSLQHYLTGRLDIDWVIFRNETIRKSNEKYERLKGKPDQFIPDPEEEIDIDTPLHESGIGCQYWRLDDGGTITAW